MEIYKNFYNLFKFKQEVEFHLPKYFSSTDMLSIIYLESLSLKIQIITAEFAFKLRYMNLTEIAFLHIVCYILLNKYEAKKKKIQTKENFNLNFFAY